MTTKRSPQVKVHDEAPAASPTQELVAAALKPETVTDAKGRAILVRKPSVLAQFRIVQAVGPDLAANHTYMQMVNPLIYVGEIDGDPVALPNSLREVEALIMRLGEEGLDAVMTWYMVNVIAPMTEALEAEQTKARLKNS